MISRDKLIRYLQIALGATLISVSTNIFSLPAGLLSAGLSGLAIIINYSIGIPVGIIYFILNLPLVFLSFKLLNTRFTLTSFFAVLVMNASQVLLSGLIGILGKNDLILHAVFSGALSGMGAGLVYRNGSSTMGTDVPAMILKQKFNISMATTSFILNLIIISVAAFLYGFEIALYTIISIYINTQVADKIMLGVGQNKSLIIITKRFEKITEEIQTKISRGVTLLDGRGGYSKSQFKIIMTVINTRELVIVKEILRKHDPDAFMTVYESSEVRGKGFYNYDS